MANRSYKQFMYSQERQPVKLMGSFTQDGSVGDFATLLSNGITYTADRMGSYGNDITIEIVDGGTAGSEVVTVSGKSISIEIEDTVSTRTQVKTALDNSAAASALISVSVSSGATAASLLVETPLAGGDDTVWISDAKDMEILQLATGIYQITLQDQFFALLNCSLSLQLATAADKMPQMQSADVQDDQTIVFRVQTAATPANLVDTNVIYVELTLRNSGS